MIVQMAGLPGTGKSAIATRLEPLLPGRVLLLDKDRVRLALFGPRHVDYTREQDDFCVSLMHDTAAHHLRHHHDAVVILDGRTCSRAYQVRQVQQLAARSRRHLKIIHCVCDDDTARLRLTRDCSPGRHPAANRDIELFERLSASSEPITAHPLLRINTDSPLDSCVEQAVCFLTGTHSPHQGEP